MPSVGEDSQLLSAKHSCENFLPSFSHPISHLDLQYCCKKFAIRDYVRSMRSKSIKDNWPFSSKSLQLCINHGVKDVLPNFHDPFGKEGHSLKKRLVDGWADARWCKCLDESELQFLAKEASPPITESPLPFYALSSSHSLKETHNTKKRRIIVKISGKPGCNAAEESAWGSDSMASKVCPVCKAFSSSSNTTLNAHIDQCLSAQAAPLAAEGCKHQREKRKKRLMTDVYATAKYCTVEDLELRNGIRRFAGSSSEDVGGKQRASNEDEPSETKLKRLSEEEDLRFPAFVLGCNSKGRRSSRPHKKNEAKYPRMVDVENDNLVAKTKENANRELERFPVIREKRRRKLYRSSRAIVDKARRFSSFRRRILADAKITEDKLEEVYSDKMIDCGGGADFSTFTTLQYDGVAREFEMPSGLCRTENFAGEFCFEESSFPTVDPIPIPGPPGSYLPPSPEDFHLAGSRVQSSVDMPEVLDGDSSDSPISAASTVSNSVVIPPSLTLQTVQENAPAPFSQPKELPERASEIGFLQLKNDQHCCCQRKETYLNYEEMESVRRRTMNSAAENHATWHPNSGFSNCGPASTNPILRLMGKNLMVVNRDDESTARMDSNPAGGGLLRNGPAIGESSNYARRSEHWWREGVGSASFAASSNYALRTHYVAGEPPRAATNLNLETRGSEFSRYGSSVYPLGAPLFYYHPAFGINFVDQHPTHK